MCQRKYGDEYKKRFDKMIVCHRTKWTNNAHTSLKYFRINGLKDFHCGWTTGEKQSYNKVFLSANLPANIKPSNNPVNKIDGDVVK